HTQTHTHTAVCTSGWLSPEPCGFWGLCSRRMALSCVFTQTHTHPHTHTHTHTLSQRGATATRWKRDSAVSWVTLICWALGGPSPCVFCLLWSVLRARA